MLGEPFKTLDCRAQQLTHPLGLVVSEVTGTCLCPPAQLLTGDAKKAWVGQRLEFWASRLGL